MVKGTFAYQDAYLKKFNKNYEKFKSLRSRIDKKCEQVLKDPYTGTEFLADATHGLNLKGCRSIRVDLNVRIIFVICEECRRIKDCAYCFCEGLPDKAVVFLTVNTHQRAYELK
ncbi:MAG: type II toxin-antitoxin system RelE family toxin [bacterium]